MTNIRQCYDMQKVYDKCTIKRDLQKVVRQSYHISYDKVMTKCTTAH